MTEKGKEMIRVCLAFVFWGVGLSFAVETRTWTDGTGARFEGTYNKELLGGVQIKDLKGANHLIRIEQLSKADRDYIEQHVPPKVTVKVGHKTRMLPRTEWSRDDDDTTVYTFDVAIKKTSKFPYKGRLFAELFILANERSIQSDRHLVLMDRRKTNFIFPEEKKSQYKFSVPDIQFNAYRANWITLSKAVDRGKTYLGYLVAVSDSAGQIIFCDTDISGIRWLTDDLSLSVKKLRDLYMNHPGSIESRHFNNSFKKIDPPRIPWFQRTNHD